LKKGKRRITNSTIVDAKWLTKEKLSVHFVSGDGGLIWRSKRDESAGFVWDKNKTLNESKSLEFRSQIIVSDRLGDVSCGETKR